VLLVGLVLGIAALVGVGYLYFYGGYGGPIDWIMGTDRHGPRGRKVVALTFDDGPDPVRTPALLDALDELEAPATFFVVGRDVRKRPGIVRRIAEAGHELGNHTYHHRYLPFERRKSVEHELRMTDRAIEDATGVVPKIARPPWGARRPSTVRVFAQLAKRLVLWDVNSYDWKGRPAHEIVERVLERVKSGSIVLLHEARDGGEVTVEAVRMLVPALRARGYTLVTASEAIA
jgi:peptidoglycan/xylan/chitin deacetylase (PgdA/CDA1 family)